MRPGPLYMVAAALVFTVMLGFVKVVRAELSAIDLVFWRGLTSVPVAVLMARGGTRAIVNRRVFALRLGMGFLAMGCFFTAAKGLALADLTLITKLQPIAMGVVAPLVIGASERPGRRVWSGLLLGLVGCSVLLAPDLAVGSTWGLWAVGAALASTGAHLCLRVLGSTDRAAAIVLWFQIGVTVLAGALLLSGFGTRVVPSPHLWIPLGLVGACASCGQWLMTRAYALERAAVIGVISYVMPVFAVVGDVLFFRGWPALHVWIGGGVILFGLPLGMLGGLAPQTEDAASPQSVR